MTDTSAPKRIWARVNGASTDVISGQRGLIGGWFEHEREGFVEYVRADAIGQIEYEKKIAQKNKDFPNGF